MAASKATKQYETSNCVVCKHSFSYIPVENHPAPRICGQLMCRSSEWSPEEWAGQARMARARIAAGVDLNELDRVALSKGGVHG